MIDFTPTAAQITLHGLGFIQVVLPANRRLHVWHPDLPRRRCYEHSAIHNHRFAFRSTVLVGVQVNRRYEVTPWGADGTHDMVSYAGQRAPECGRLSFVDGLCIVEEQPDECYHPGESYMMPMLAFHETPNTGIVVTMMEKIEEGTVHAHSLIRRGHIFDHGFDRFQLSADRLWALVVDALKMRHA